MFKSSFSLAQLALAVSIVLTASMPLSSLAGSSELCRHVFIADPSYKRMNPTAKLDAERYPMPNARSMNEYEISLLPDGLRFRDLLSRDAVVVDVGGGQGRAMSELAQSLPVHTVVINTQDFSALHRTTRFRGSLEYRAGWAEQELKKLPTGSVDMVVDLWGGFSYSPNKAEILEDVYRVLKPGGRAFILFPSKTPATIDDARYNYGQPVPLSVYLSRVFKDVFKVRAPHASDLLGAKVIEIFKPESGEPATLDLNLATTDVRQGPGRQSVFPAVTYSLKP